MRSRAGGAVAPSRKLRLVSRGPHACRKWRAVAVNQQALWAEAHVDGDITARIRRVHYTSDLFIESCYILYRISLKKYTQPDHPTRRPTNNIAVIGDQQLTGASKHPRDQRAVGRTSRSVGHSHRT